MKKLALIALAAFALSASASTTATREMVTNFCANVAQAATNYTDAATVLNCYYTEWIVTPATSTVASLEYELSVEQDASTGKWALFGTSGTYHQRFGDWLGDSESTELSWSHVEGGTSTGAITAFASRHLAGYLLGDQTAKPLQPAGDYALPGDVAAAAAAATNYTDAAITAMTATFTNGLERCFTSATNYTAAAVKPFADSIDVTYGVTITTNALTLFSQAQDMGTASGIHAYAVLAVDNGDSTNVTDFVIEGNGGEYATWRGNLVLDNIQLVTHYGGGVYLKGFAVYVKEGESVSSWTVIRGSATVAPSDVRFSAPNPYALSSAIDYTSGNSTLVSTIESVAPAPGDYSNVSNLAVTAVQPGDNVSVLANDAGYLTDFTETDPEWAAASPTITADIATNAADIAELQSTATFLYHIYSGSNAVFEVTNYNSQVHQPRARLLSLTNGTEYAVVWAETNGLSSIASAATNYTDSAILAATNRYAVRAWSATTSGLGADAPAETTWISTPTTVLAGGYEYTKTVTSAGQVWILTQNGMTTLGPDSQSYLDISSGSGDSLIKIEKTDSYLVGVAATNITVSGSTVTIAVPVVSANHPYARYAASLASPVTWYKEEDSDLPSGVTVAWSGSSGAWVCTVTTSASQGYFFFEFVQEGSTKITLGGSLDVTNGIYYNGVKYVPTVSGTELKFIAE